VEKVETITMSQKDGDIAQVDGVTVGGAKFGEDGGWAGKWSDLIQRGYGKKKDRLKIEVPPASAVLIRLRLRTVSLLWDLNFFEDSSFRALEVAGSDSVSYQKKAQIHAVCTLINTINTCNTDIYGCNSYF
jgi:hypothetical protein